MKLTIEPTAIIEKIDGVDCRLWEGTSDKGVPVKAWVRTVQPQTHDEDALAAFDAELAPTAPVFQSVEVLEVNGRLSVDDLTEGHIELVERLRPLFAGIHPMVQGSVLAYLTALWVMGHQVDGEMQRALYAQHQQAIEAMFPLAREEIAAIKARMEARLQ